MAKTIKSFWLNLTWKSTPCCSQKVELKSKNKHLQIAFQTDNELISFVWNLSKAGHLNSYLWVKYSIVEEKLFCFGGISKTL